ncbi:hypothetical protein A6U85_14850 [Agrobacterium sp. 13-626]|nr:hypothetical protein CN09_22060 [Rhizobium rhizogenes]MQB31352.1 hypothetical protein [Rhizobium rhizogenes]OCI96009.1 hypothetical protein A6U85_14850 [Agrobacterium sp. 13-626]
MKKRLQPKITDRWSLLTGYENGVLRFSSKRVTFGRKLALDRTSIHIGRRSLPLTTIADFHFIDGTDNGDDYRKLKIRTLRKEYTIDERKISNPQVVAGLFQQLADGI